MKSIAYSQLIGKWYQIARTYNRFEMNFVEVFLYFSLACNETLDSLYVGVKSDRGKMLRKLSSKVLDNKNDVNLSFNNLCPLTAVLSLALSFFSSIRVGFTFNLAKFFLSKEDFYN